MENPFSKYRKGETVKSVETLFRVMEDGAMKVASIEDFRGEKGDSIRGDDGRGIKKLFLKAKNLIVSYTDGSSDNIGVIVGNDGKDGVSIVDTNQNAKGELVVYYSNGTEKNCGLIRGKDGEDGKPKDGKDGRGIKNCEINENGEFCIYYTDGTEENHGKIKEDRQNNIVSGMSSFGVGVRDNGSLVGMGFTNINFTGSGINSITKSGREVTIDVSGGGGGGGAPTNATYVTLSTNATLTNERVLTAGTGLDSVDGGAGGALTLSLDAATQASLALADSAIQAGDLGSAAFEDAAAFATAAQGATADSAAQFSFRTISVSGQSDVVADSATDTLTLVAGTNITITTNATTDAITINSTGGGSGSFDYGTSYALAAGLTLYGY